MNPEVNEPNSPWHTDDLGRIVLRGSRGAAAFDPSGVQVVRDGAPAITVPVAEIDLVAFLLPHLPLGPVLLAPMSVMSWLQTAGPRYSWGIDLVLGKGMRRTRYHLGRPKEAPYSWARRNAAYALSEFLCGGPEGLIEFGTPGLGLQMLLAAETVGSRSETKTARDLEPAIEELRRSWQDG